MTAFKALRDLQAQHTAEVVPSMICLSLRGNQANQCHEALAALEGNACLKMSGVRLRPDRGQKSQMVKDPERQYLALPYTDWTARAATWAQRERSSKTEWK